MGHEASPNLCWTLTRGRLSRLWRPSSFRSSTPSPPPRPSPPREEEGEGEGPRRARDAARAATNGRSRSPAKSWSTFWKGERTYLCVVVNQNIFARHFWLVLKHGVSEVQPVASLVVFGIPRAAAAGRGSHVGGRGRGGLAGWRLLRAAVRAGVRQLFCWCRCFFRYDESEVSLLSSRG